MSSNCSPLIFLINSQRDVLRSQRGLGRPAPRDRNGKEVATEERSAGVPEGTRACWISWVSAPGPEAPSTAAAGPALAALGQSPRLGGGHKPAGLADWGTGRARAWRAVRPP